MDYLESVKQRRSVYDLGKDIDLFDQELINLIKYNLKYTPSSYNSQSQRVLLLLNHHHDKFWNTVMAALRDIVPEDKFPRTENKINGFKNAYGTILFFDDLKVTNALIEKYPEYKQNTLNWAQQQNGMLQINIWQTLKSRDIGASLQHYNELIEKDVDMLFDIPYHWKLVAQMPFGHILSEPPEKMKTPVEDRLIIKK